MYTAKNPGVTIAGPDHQVTTRDIAPVAIVRSRLRVGPYEAAAYLILVGLAAALVAWIYRINISPLPPLSGSWRVVHAENLPPMLASTWQENTAVFLTADGQVIFQAGPPGPNDRNALGVISRSVHERGYYTLSHLNSDWRMSSVSFRVDVSKLPYVLALTGLAGSRVFLVRATRGQ